MVTLKEYACAIEGIEHVVLDGMGKVRVAPPTRYGGPKNPVNPKPARVSTTRHGVIPTNTRAPAGIVACVVVLSVEFTTRASLGTARIPRPARSSATLGC